MQPLTPNQDPTLNRLVIYVANYLNNSYTERVVVRSTRCYDAFLVPHNEFPLLKIYRISDRHSLNSTLTDSRITVAYCLLNVVLEEIPGIMRWVSVKLGEALRCFKLENPGLIEFDESFSVRYRTVMQLGEIIYQLEADFSISDESVQC